MAERPGDSFGVDGIGYDDLAAFPPQPGTKAGRKFKSLGQTGNRASGGSASVANQDCGTVAIGAIGAGATAVLTIDNSLITTLSLLRVQPKNVLPVVAAGRHVVANPRLPIAGHCDVDVYSATAINAGDYELDFWITN